jgi:hypothetical protein
MPTLSGFDHNSEEASRLSMALALTKKLADSQVPRAQLLDADALVPELTKFVVDVVPSPYSNEYFT